MTDPAFDLAAGLIGQAEQNIPQPMQPVPPTTIADWVKPAIRPTIMDEEDALQADTKEAVTRLVAGAQDMAQVAQQALELVAAQRERADKLHEACARSLLMLVRREFINAQEVLENALDIELQPTEPTQNQP